MHEQDRRMNRRTATERWLRACDDNALRLHMHEDELRCAVVSMQRGRKGHQQDKRAGRDRHTSPPSDWLLVRVTGW